MNKRYVEQLMNSSQICNEYVNSLWTILTIYTLHTKCTLCIKMYSMMDVQQLRNIFHSSRSRLLIFDCVIVRFHSNCYNATILEGTEYGMPNDIKMYNIFFKSGSKKWLWYTIINVIILQVIFWISYKPFNSKYIQLHIQKVNVQVNI